MPSLKWRGSWWPPRIRCLSLDRAARTPAGLACLMELAETLQAPVVDQAGRMNFPTRHPLNQTDRGARGRSPNADVILGLEVADLYGTRHTYRDQIERTSRSGIETRCRSFISISFGRSFHQEQLSGFPALHRSRSGHCRGCRSDAAFADRSREAPDHRRSQARLSGSRRASLKAAHSRPSSARATRPLMAGTPARSAPRACARRSGAQIQDRRLVAGRRHNFRQPLAAALVGFQQALSVHRRRGRLRHRLRRARGCRRGAGQPQARPPDREHPMRRRSDVRARSLVDGRASPHSRCCTSCTTIAPIIRK